MVRPNVNQPIASKKTMANDWKTSIGNVTSNWQQQQWSHPY